MLNVFRVNHFVYDMRNPEMMDAFKKDPEGEMDRYHLNEDDKKPIREKNMQPLLDAGINPNVLRSLCQALGIPPINLSPRMSGSQRLEDLQKQLVASSGRPSAQGTAPEMTPEEAQKRKRVKEIEAELKLSDPMARARR